MTNLPTNHSKVAHTLKFNFHSDAGHGWLAVKMSLVRELGIGAGISQCSYMKGETAYLEEDCDMLAFMVNFERKFGVKPNIKHLDSKERSPIRSMNRFKMEA